MDVYIMFVKWTSLPDDNLDLYQGKMKSLYQLPIIGPITTRTIKFVLNSTLAQIVVLCWTSLILLPFLYILSKLLQQFSTLSFILSPFRLNGMFSNTFSDISHVDVITHQALLRTRTALSLSALGQEPDTPTTLNRSSMPAPNSSNSQAYQSTLPNASSPIIRRLRKHSSSSGLTSTPSISTAVKLPRNAGMTRSSESLNSLTSLSSAELPDIPPFAIVRTPSSSFETKKKQTPTPAMYSEQFITLANGIQICYMDIQPPSAWCGSSSNVNAPNRGTIVLLHGGLGWTWTYSKVIPLLLDQGFRIVCFDYPGHGKSDKPTNSKFITLGLYVCTIIDIFTKVVIQPEDSQPVQQSFPPTIVCCHGISASIFPLAMHAAPHIARVTSHLILISPMVPLHLKTRHAGRPTCNVFTKHMAMCACAQAALMLTPALGMFLGQIFTPRISTLAEACSGTVRRSESSMIGYDLPYPINGPPATLAPIAIIHQFPVPYLSEIPTEQILHLFNASSTSPSSKSPPTSAVLDGTHIGVSGSISPGRHSWDSGIVPETRPSKTLDSPRLFSGIGTLLSEWIVSAVRNVSDLSNRQLALDMDIAMLYLRQWTDSPPPPLVPLANVSQQPTPHLPPPRHRVLVVTGAKDPLGEFGADATWYKHWCDAYLVNILNAGRYPELETPLKVVDAILEFMNE